MYRLDMLGGPLVRRITSASLIGAMLLTSCAPGAQAISLRPAPTLDKKDVLEFKDHGERVAITAVTLAGDSLSGVDWRYPTDARHTYAIADLSDVKVNRAQNAGAQLGSTVVVLGLLIALAVAVVGPKVGGN